MANWVLRRYPQPWRRRYAREMEAVLDQIPVTWGQVLDLAGGAVREWMSPRALGWPARSAAASVQKARRLQFVAVAYALDGLARLAAWKLTATGLTIPDQVESIVLAAGGLCTLRFCLAMFSSKRWPGMAQRFGAFRPWEVAIFSVVMTLFFAIGHAKPPSSHAPTLDAIANAIRPWMYSLPVARMSVRSIRLKRIEMSYLKRRRILI